MQNAKKILNIIRKSPLPLFFKEGFTLSPRPMLRMGTPKKGDEGGFSLQLRL